MKTYLNLGCGQRVHPGWVNIDLVARQPGVFACDLINGIPVETESADAVYHAAVLEHFRRPEAAKFLQEIYRVLKPGGIIRVGVPNLEEICQTYLDKLHGALAGDEQASRDYDWMVIEMLDQLVREKSGGEMAGYFRQQPLPNESFVFGRIGDEGRKLSEAMSSGRPRSGRSKIRGVAKALQKGLLVLVAGKDSARALAIGRFRLSGEVHHWMYDRFSLARELKAAGFRDTKVCKASDSAIDGWHDFHLDVLPDGTVAKPDLFFMEATKPKRAGHG